MALSEDRHYKRVIQMLVNWVVIVSGVNSQQKSSKSRSQIADESTSNLRASKPDCLAASETPNKSISFKGREDKRQSCLLASIDSAV